MEKIIFAKIVELDEAQVLLLKKDGDYDSDIMYRVVMITELGDARPEMSVGFENEIKRDEYFNNFGEDEAKGFFDVVNQMYDEE